MQSDAAHRHAPFYTRELSNARIKGTMDLFFELLVLADYRDGRERRLRFMM